MNEEMAHWLDIVRNSRGVPGETDHFFHMQKHWRIFEPYLDGLVSFFLTAIPGGAAAWNQLVYSFSDKYQNQKTSDALFEYFMLVLSYISLVSL